MDKVSFERPGARKRSGSARDARCMVTALNVVVLGASGDLAKKKTFPALYALYHQGYLPKNLNIIGYARSEMTDQSLRERVQKFLKGDQKSIQTFLNTISYVSGSYVDAPGFQKLQQHLRDWEDKEYEDEPVGRLYYLALPPSAYASVVKGLKENVDMEFTHPRSWLRIIVEKPFGKDLQSSEDLSKEIAQYWPEEKIFRIDHYLGKELTQNLIVLRFSNAIIAPSWNRHHVANVQICFKEPFGTEGRGGYFDQFGIIRDVIQNHLIQVMALIAMEKPVSLSADDIRDEKVKVLRSIPPVTVQDCVLGQYTAGNGMPGYLDDEGVPKDSVTPTFAMCVLHIENDRWSGVPFILKAGKALNERKVEIRVQFKAPVSLPGSNVKLDEMRNELVMRLQPSEAIYMKLAVKKPGLDNTPIMSELDLSYQVRYHDEHIPEAYERLLLDAIHGDQQHFVRRDELSAAWSIFTPLLHAIDDNKHPPLKYTAGTRGPPEADSMVRKQGFKKNEEYSWRPSIDMARASMEMAKAAL